MSVRGKLRGLLFVLSVVALGGLLGPAAGQPPAKSQPPAKGQPPAKAKATENPVENYYRDARVGDWVSYNTGAGATASTIKHTVTAKTADEVTIKYEMAFGGMSQPPTEVKINLKEPFDPNKQNAPDVTTTVEKQGSGKETLTIGGKKYDCDWEKTKMTHTQKAAAGTPAQTMVVVTKTWTCKDVPLGGVVKTEMEMLGQTTVTELTGSGRGR
jgi:hypothetical protein